MRFNPIFFDLDGTITDSAQGIIRAVQYALEAFNISASKESLIPFIGPPLRDSFSQFFPGDTEKLEQVVAKYREYYG